jgi:hypothetical protein
MGESATTRKSAGMVIAMWQRGALGLWTIAAACLMAFIALLTGARSHLSDAEVLLTTYGADLVLAILALSVFASVKSYSERAGRPLALIENVLQSHWCQTKQPSGEVITLIALWFQVTNFSKRSVMLTAMRLARPWVRRRRIRQTTLSVRHPLGLDYGSDFPISPHSLTHGCAHIIIDRPIGRIGKTMRVVVRIQDHAGRWYRLVFPHVEMTGGPQHPSSYARGCWPDPESSIRRNSTAPSRPASARPGDGP